MSYPKPNWHVVAHKRRWGRVTVHGFELVRFREDDFRAMTDCGLTVEKNNYAWMWVELRTLNPEMVDLCRRCWVVEEP